MDEILGPQLICRACLRIVENKTQSFGFIEDCNGNLKDMIMCCVPEMDIYVSSNPIMCFPCIQLLVNVYNFKTRCLNTETIIRSFIQRNNLEYNHINLNCVVQELIRLNTYFQDIQYRMMDDGRNTNVPQDQNVLPKVPFPDEQFRLLEKEENDKDHVMGMEHGHFLSEYGRRSDPEDVRRNGDVTEHQFGLSRHETMSQGLTSVPVLSVNQNARTSSEISTNAELVSDVSAGDEQCVTFEDCEHQNAQRCVTDTNKTVGGDLHKTGESCTDKEAVLSSEDSDRSTEDVTKDSTSNDSLKETEGTETRPRLIIKISKNKVTIPSYKNEDSNEKENEEMDVQTNDMEMPLPDSSPFNAYQPPDPNRQEIYQCEHCTFVTTHLQYYDTHKKICPNEEKKCPHCPHVTSRQYALNKHINTMHTRAMWYICEFCPYRSTDPSCLRRHKRNVHPEKLENDLMCELCRYRCTTEYHLKKHMVKHKDSMALQCQFCSYSTRDRSNFRKHVFIHNPKPKMCEFCDYKCVSPYQMKLHLKKLHHGIGMEDVDCKSEASIHEVVQDISAAINEMKSVMEKETE